MDMDLEKIDSTEMGKLETGSKSDSSFVMQVVSGPESEDILVDIELVSDKSPDSQSEIPKPIFVSEELEKNNKLWKKVRTHANAGRLVDGWVTPIDTPVLLDGENSLAQGLSDESLEKEKPIEVHVENEIKELKTVCEAGLANLLSEQAKVKETIGAFPKLFERDSNTKQKTEIVKIINLIQQLEGAIEKLSTDSLSKQDEIETFIKAINLKQIQGNLDIIYRGIKKSIENSRNESEGLSIQLKELVSKVGTSDQAVLKLESVLTGYLQEVTLNQEIFLRLEDNFESLKKKLPLFFGVILLPIVLIGLKVFALI